jgi:hypothetical protein
MDKFPYVIFKNDTTTITFTITKNGSAFNLTGSTVVFMAKRKTSDDDDDAEIDVECTLTDAANGICTAAIVPTNSGTFIAELEYRKDSDIFTLDQWEFVVTADVRQGS